MVLPDRWKDRANNIISQGGLTNSKWPESLINGLYPTHIKSATECYIYDTNNKRYTDFICGLGSNLFGYGNQKITDAVIKQLYNGVNHSLPTIHEVECGEKLKEMLPFIERVKWLKTGSDACNAAIRFARAYTGKNVVLSAGYHGIADQFVSLTPPAKGVTKQSAVALFNGDMDLFDFKDVAAIIIEPVITDYTKTRIEFLRKLREVTAKNNTLLIFDEVITGLRWEKYSVSQRYKIIPDLICLGKAVGGGWSLAGVAGRADILDDKEVFISSTYAGETAPLIAGKTAMELLQRDSNYNMDELWRSGQEFIDKFNEMGGVQITGYPTRGSFVGTLEDRALFCQEAAISGLLFHPSTWFYNFPHMKVSYDALNIIEAVKTKIRLGRAKLNYPLPTTPFAAKLREKSQ